MPHILVIDAPYYSHISKGLVAGAEAVLKDRGATWDKLDVPGVLEIPAAVSMALEGMATGGKHYDGFVTLGCVIRGETAHFDIVAFESARAIMDLTIAECLALGNGIQTTENEEQAKRRADTDDLNKGGHAASAALDMIELRNHLMGA
ncbi:6,7-dimethyl-8-ribityllumazine synthase [Ahrensia sp. R2A130]|uniref:6,7-dimethyl-8-ribityllumazine synthase n=1 Tax=Ahrensia sp. R2A130 TaxID=744979 RepID=UPI0001E083BB|nr:6,7-dimethyl-8-ribityllumazine synthase [Ahrensia sp. R2A130]EFL90527.1 6,7-dimethyl-8-ribityllumazine synthase [Ahrensia sp. R2A130]